MQRALAAYSFDGAASAYVQLTFAPQTDDGPGSHPFLAASAEKRRSPRRRVLLSALIINADFNTIYRCRVRDVSETGAKLDIPAGYHPPNSFWLVALSSGLAYEAKLAWRNYPNVGVELGQSIDLNETQSRNGLRLRGIWASLVS